MRSKKNFLIILFIALICLIAFVVFKNKNNIIHLKKQSLKQSHPWITVFIHGSFGSLLGFFNLSNVLSDKISGTMYRDINKKLRNNDFFFKDQPILHRGLIQINPTFDINNIDGKKYAAYPAIKMYANISQIIEKKRHNYYYTFGWSGLISQNSRRFEAIRLFNALSEELVLLQKQLNCKPKIRIICHSHGGNLSLNLAAISHILHHQCWQSTHCYSEDPDENTSLHAMANTMKKLTTHELAKNNFDQKKYDYVPENKTLYIDELIMLGVPIQPETECFIYSSFFKKIYHMYSDQDFVQRLDWVSSKKTLSNQRFSLSIFKKKSARALHIANNVKQIRLMTEKKIHHNRLVTTTPIKQPGKNNLEPSVIDDIIAGKNIFVRSSKDPTHKELWFFQWHNNDVHTTFFSPFPTVILVPLIINTVSKSLHGNDFDIVVNNNKTMISAYLFGYNKCIVRASQHIPKTMLDMAKQAIKPWKPDETSQIADFNTVYKKLLNF